jgi:hypothetical protein
MRTRFSADCGAAPQSARPWLRRAVCVAILVVGSMPALAHAEADEPSAPLPDDSENAATAKSAADASVPKPKEAGPAKLEVSATEVPATEARPIQAPPGVAPWFSAPFDSGMTLEWHGGFEMDVGYASYTHETESLRPETFQDFRGRFVAGPVLRRDFGPDYFFRASGQMVAWVREQASIYQVNVDDVYAQVGKKGVWDLTVGRFMTWRVYRKGLGWDLYTLEDTGATYGTFADVGKFYPHTYEVDDIFLRATPGRAAVHLYPTPWSGIELVGQYGRLEQDNILGGRAAAGVTFSHFNASAAGEYLRQSPALQSGSNDTTTGAFIPCDTCGVTKRRGVGGGATFNFSPVELGLSAATERVKSVQPNGTPDTSASGKRTSFGGYAEFDVGKFVIGRALIIGAGLHRTEQLADSGDFKRHVQEAGYIAFPLGFNNAMLKFVYSKADGVFRNSQGLEQRDHMGSGRLRLRFDF